MTRMCLDREGFKKGLCSHPRPDHRFVDQSIEGRDHAFSHKTRGKESIGSTIGVKAGTASRQLNTRLLRPSGRVDEFVRRVMRRPGIVGALKNRVRRGTVRLHPGVDDRNRTERTSLQLGNRCTNAAFSGCFNHQIVISRRAHLVDPWHCERRDPIDASARNLQVQPLSHRYSLVFS